MQKYGNYKDTGIEWLGVIPTHWEIKKTKHVCQFYNGWTPPTNTLELFSGNNKWLNISDIRDNKYVYDTENCISDEAIQQSNIQISPKDSLLFSFKLSIGQVCFAGIDLYTNEAVATFAPSYKLNLHYAYYVFPICIAKNAKYNIYGAKLLNQDLIANAVLCYPPLQEQQQIANYLDKETTKIVQLIQKQNKLIATLQEKKQAVIQQTITRGIKPQAIVFDLFTFNQLLKEPDLFNKLPLNTRYYATNSQIIQIEKVKSLNYRQKLLLLFNKITNKQIIYKNQKQFTFKQIENIVAWLTTKHDLSNITIISTKSFKKAPSTKKINSNNCQILSFNEFTSKYLLKDSGIKWLKQIPIHWSETKIRWSCKVFSGGTPDKSNLKYWANGKIPWLNSGTVNQWHITETTEFITQLGFNMSNAKWIPSQSVVLALAGQGKTKGMVALTTFATTCNQSLAAIIPLINNYLSSKYLLYWLHLNYENIRNLAGGNLRDGLNLEMIKDIKLPLPPITEQQQITKYLDQQIAKIDNLITKAKQMITLLKEYEQSLINHVVTGKIKITN